MYCGWVLEFTSILSAVLFFWGRVVALDARIEMLIVAAGPIVARAKPTTLKSRRRSHFQPYEMPDLQGLLPDPIFEVAARIVV